MKFKYLIAVLALFIASGATQGETSELAVDIVESATTEVGPRRMGTEGDSLGTCVT